MMTITTLKSIPARENPFHYDAYHMGTPIADNVMIMHHTFSKDKARYIIVIDMETGQRLRIEFDK